MYGSEKVKGLIFQHIDTSFSETSDPYWTRLEIQLYTGSKDTLQATARGNLYMR